MPFPLSNDKGHTAEVNKNHRPTKKNYQLASPFVITEAKGTVSFIPPLRCQHSNIISSVHTLTQPSRLLAWKF